MPGYQNVLYGDGSVEPHREGYYVDALDQSNFSVEGQGGRLYYWAK